MFEILKCHPNFRNFVFILAVLTNLFLIALGLPQAVNVSPIAVIAFFLGLACGPIYSVAFTFLLTKHPNHPTPISKTRNFNIFIYTTIAGALPITYFLCFATIFGFSTIANLFTPTTLTNFSAIFIYYVLFVASSFTSWLIQILIYQHLDEFSEK